MKIKIIKSHKNAHRARGLTVVIDVLRAFTTASFILHKGAVKIISVANLETAYKLKKDNPSFVLVGERGGLKLEGFDYGNSPAEISNISLENKTVVLTTSVGTQGIANSINADEIITGAFVNAGAIVSYINKKKPDILSFVCTDDRYINNEDFMLAKYIISHLEGNPLNFPNIKKGLMNHPTTVGFLQNPMTAYSAKDFHLSLSLDTFDFLIKAEREDGLVHLKKADKN